MVSKEWDPFALVKLIPEVSASAASPERDVLRGCYRPIRNNTNGDSLSARFSAMRKKSIDELSAAASDESTNLETVQNHKTQLDKFAYKWKEALLRQKCDLLSDSLLAVLQVDGDENHKMRTLLESKDTEALTQLNQFLDMVQKRYTDDIATLRDDLRQVNIDIAELRKQRDQAMRTARRDDVVQAESERLLRSLQQEKKGLVEQLESSKRNCTQIQRQLVEMTILFQELRKKNYELQEKLDATSNQLVISEENEEHFKDDFHRLEDARNAMIQKLKNVDLENSRLIKDLQQANTNHHEDKGDLGAKMNQVTKENENLNREKEILKKEVEKLNRMNASLVEENRALRNENMGLVGENARQNEESGNLRDENAKHREESARLREESAKQKEENGNLRDENTKQRDENGKLRYENESLAAESANHREDNGKLRQENASLFEKNAEQREENAALIGDNGRLRAENASLAEENGLQKEENEKQRREREKHANANAQLVEESGQLREANQKLAEESGKLAQENEKLTETNGRLTKQNEEITQENVSLREKNENLARETTRLGEENAKLNEENGHIYEENGKLHEELNQVKKTTSVSEASAKKEESIASKSKRRHFSLRKRS